MQTTPIIVQVMEQPVESTSIADVIIGALGLTGALVLAAILLGAVLGGLLIAFKKLRAHYDLEPVPDSEALRITPGGTH